MPTDLQTTSEKYCSIWALYLICSEPGVFVVTHHWQLSPAVCVQWWPLANNWLPTKIEGKVTIFPQNCAQNDLKDGYSVSFSDFVLVPRNDKEARFASAVLVSLVDSGQ